jgi:hypothetical protein
MRQLVYGLELNLQLSNSKVDLFINNLRLKHPVFQHISIYAFRYLIEKSFLFKLSNGQLVYREGLKAMNHVYFILYGDIRFERHKGGTIGDTLSVGATAGEEIIFYENIDVNGYYQFSQNSPVQI